ncbi:MAG: type II toxin-antitoxin system RelE/ParE family toxin [Pyramidobacter sp.]|nr:type II toxin-antitoxin system RelE/ParE family toxin [Pyramidobacter sp.]
MRVVYSPRARSRLRELRTQLRTDYGDETAEKVLNAIFDSADRLAEFPFSGASFAGRFGFKTDLHYLLTQHNYLVYRIADETVMILLVCREREDLIRRVFKTPRGDD